MALELAEIFRAYGAAYRQKYAERLLPSHHQAMRAIAHRGQVVIAVGRFYSPAPARTFPKVVALSAEPFAPAQHSPYELVIPCWWRGMKSQTE
jgi:hypothetical protein